MKKADPQDIFLIEDHQEAYYILKERSLSALMFDAHDKCRAKPLSLFKNN